jgi:hypothetical protein
MKKLTVGLLAVGAVTALRPELKRRIVQKMQEHCKTMMARFACRGEATMREHCEQMAVQHEEHREPVATA